MVETLAATKPASKITLPDMILATKLYIPPARPNLVPRPHLITRLNDALRLGHKLTLLSASPGFGKTTLVSSWIYDVRFTIYDTSTTLSTGFGLTSTEEDETQNPKSKIQNRVAWLSLDEDDNNPQRFLTYCIAALQTIQPGVGQATLAMLRNPGLQPFTPDMLVTALINEITSITNAFVFVFDDYHVIENQLIHESMAFLLDNMPPQVQLVIAGRTDPPWSLSRLRARGQLTELGAADLRFTPDEAATFLNQTMDLNLSTAEVTALETRTEGWIAGLQMAALAMQGPLAMQGVKDTTGFVKAFTGSHRHVLDYLLEEVLYRQPEHIQHFLLQTSILNRLTGSLCDAVLGKKTEEQPDRVSYPKETSPVSPLFPASSASSQELLEYIEQANLFIVPLDDERCWYRYHHLFADLLRHRLDQASSSVPKALKGGVAVLHCRASDWYERNGLVTEAMDHALAAVDVERVVRLAKQKAATMLSRSELITLLSWLDTLPDALDRTQPRLSLLHAWAMVLTGQFQAVETHLAEAERAFTGEGFLLDTGQNNILGEVATLRGGVAYFQRDMPQAIALYQQALEHLPPDNLFLRGIVMQCLGAAYSWCGDVAEASRAFRRAGAISQDTGNIQVALIALGYLARLEWEQGRLHQAVETYRHTLQLADRQAGTGERVPSSLIGRSHIGLAEVMYQWNDLESATRYAQEGIKLADQEQESSALTGGYLVLAHLCQAQGDDAGTFEAIQKARRFAQRYTGPRYLADQVDIYQAQLWLVQGNLPAVANWIQESNLQVMPLPDEIPYLREGEYLVLARLLLIQGNHPTDQGFLSIDSPLTVAVELLARIIETTTQAKRMDRALQALVLQALAFCAQDQTEHALNTLKQALSLAKPEGYVRYFVDEGKPMADLLRQAAAQNIVPTYISKLLTAFPDLSDKTKIQNPKSKIQNLVDPLSERELEILRLIATGMSNRDLADELIVTVGTVKWHLNNIYSKLAVRSRTQAIARARELGLL